jgi:hypothetical protein
MHSLRCAASHTEHIHSNMPTAEKALEQVL